MPKYTVGSAVRRLFTQIISIQHILSCGCLLVRRVAFCRIMKVVMVYFVIIYTPWFPIVWEHPLDNFARNGEITNIENRCPRRRFQVFFYVGFWCLVCLTRHSNVLTKPKSFSLYFCAIVDGKRFTWSWCPPLVVSVDRN